MYSPQIKDHPLHEDYEYLPVSHMEYGEYISVHIPILCIILYYSQIIFVFLNEYMQ